MRRRSQICVRSRSCACPVGRPGHLNEVASVTRIAFDYIDGAADGEVSLARAREAFANVQFNPRS